MTGDDSGYLIFQAGSPDSIGIFLTGKKEISLTYLPKRIIGSLFRI